MDSVPDEKFNIRFVETVKKYPIIYNSNIEGYKSGTNIALRQAAWMAVAKELNSDPYALHKKWMNYRTHLSKIIKIKQTGKPAPSYYLTKHLEFLIPYMKNSHKTDTSNTSIKEHKDEENKVVEEEEEDNQYEMEADPIANENEENEITEEVDEMDQDEMHLENYSNDEVLSDEADIEVDQSHEKQNETNEILHNRSDTYYEADVDVAKSREKQNRRSEVVHNRSVTYYEADVDVAKPHEKQNRRSEVVHNRSNTLPSAHVASTSTGNAESEQLIAVGDAKVQFLLSLMPDLNAMSNSEMRQFKCKVQQLVDEILNESE